MHSINLITPYIPQIVRRGDQEYLEGYAALWPDGTEGTVYRPSPHVKETVDPHAFDEVLQRGDRIELQTDHKDENIIGSTDDGLILRADDTGLRISYPFDPHDIALMLTRQRIEKRYYGGMSFRAQGVMEISRTNTGHHRVIKKVTELVEVSFVRKPAYKGTAAIVRSEIDAWEKTQELIRKIRNG